MIELRNVCGIGPNFGKAPTNLSERHYKMAPITADTGMQRSLILISVSNPQDIVLENIEQ
jgi:hypothetical protein